MYGNFQGRDAFGELTIDPSTGQVSPFMNSGDPITNTGWLDHYYSKPCDVYFMPGSGTFSLAPLDTQRVVYAVIVGQGEERMSSIVDLRRNAHFVRSSFFSGFTVKATAQTEINYISPNLTELIVRAAITSQTGVASVRAELYDYQDSLFSVLDLYDDGLHHDDAASDGVYGNLLQTAPVDSPLYLNLKLVTNGDFEERLFRHAADKIMLSNRIDITSFKIVADNINSDLKINPGENVRLGFAFSNGYSLDFKNLNVKIKTDDPGIQVESKLLRFNNVKSGAAIQLNYDPNADTTFIAMDISPAIADTQRFYLDLMIFDDQYREWHNKFAFKVEPFEYLPDEIIPAHIAGKSDAWFRILVIDPPALTGHSYMITISDSINEAGETGFNLIDHTLGERILSDHPVPDEFAHNIPITDGFKVFKAFLPEGKLLDVYYENIAGGNPTGFKGVSFGGKFFGGGILLGAASIMDFYKVELEFTNRIDSNGVAGSPSGQGAFRYELGKPDSPTGFFPCPFNVWKIVNGERCGRLNACFQEAPFLKTMNNTWDPDASGNGGMETLYIMSSDYDETGQRYQNKPLASKEILYKIFLKLETDSSVVDAGDKMIFDWQYPATSEDVFTFIPTNVNPENGVGPTSFALYQNYPNPFNHATQIHFSLKKPGNVKLTIFNIQGQKVKTLINGFRQAGTYKMIWEGTNQSGQFVASGLYFYQLTIPEAKITKKMLLLR